MPKPFDNRKTALVGRGGPNVEAKHKGSPRRCSGPQSTRAKEGSVSKMRVIAGYTFLGHFEDTAAPKTVAAFLKHMPFVGKIIHVRWSGEGVWVPLGELDFGVSFENNTCYPAPFGQPLPDPHRGPRKYLRPRAQDASRWSAGHPVRTRLTGALGAAAPQSRRSMRAARAVARPIVGLASGRRKVPIVALRAPRATSASACLTAAAI